MSGRVVATLALGVALCGCAHGHAGPPRAPEIAPADTISSLVEGDARRATAAGAGAVRIVATGAGAPGDNVGGRIEAPVDACVLFLARGSASIDDLDLFVYADDGTSLGVDETSRSSASAVVCPPHPKHLYAFARVAAGHGLLALSAQVVLPRDAARVTRLVSAKPAGDDGQPPGATWPGLDDALAAHRRTIGGTWREVRRVAVPLEPRFPTRITGVVEAGQCLDFLAAPSDDVAYTELVLSSAGGRLLGQTPAERDHPAMVVCSPEHAEVTFSLRPHGGRGLAAVVMSVATDAPAPQDGVFLYEAQAERSVPEAITALASQISRKGYAAPKRVGAGVAKVAERASIDVDLPSGCSRLDVVGGTPLRGLDTWLWSTDGALLAHDDGAARSTSYACGGAQRGRLDVEAVTRGGPFAVELRHLDTAEAALDAHPLAAGRLLAKSFVAAPGGAPPDAGIVSAVTLSSTSLVTREATVASGQCLTVTLGLGPGAEGAELRLVDADTSEEVTFVRGTDSAITESCTPNRPSAPALRLRVEMRVVAGTTDALLALRPRAMPRTPTVARDTASPSR